LSWLLPMGLPSAATSNCSSAHMVHACGVGPRPRPGAGRSLGKLAVAGAGWAEGPAGASHGARSASRLSLIIRTADALLR
jgi:hypothetical protein